VRGESGDRVRVRVRLMDRIRVMDRVRDRDMVRVRVVRVTVRVRG
jgi:hypothetical protein